MIKSKKLSKFKNIKHGFFGSKGGISNGIYNSLNCGIGSFDKKNNVKKNLNIVLKKFILKIATFFYQNRHIAISFIFYQKNQEKVELNVML